LENSDENFSWIRLMSISSVSALKGYMER
jgi:hypothetical protein